MINGGKKKNEIHHRGNKRFTERANARDGQGAKGNARERANVKTQ
jgi:hypothetical protein